MKARRDVLIENLVEQGGRDPNEDRYRCGYIAAVNDLLNISVEEVTVD